MVVALAAVEAPAGVFQKPFLSVIVPKGLVLGAGRLRGWLERSTGHKPEFRVDSVPWNAY